MERCDFSSVISIIRKYISESREINQTDLLYELFDTFTKDSQNIDYVFDNGLVCRWFKGVAKISPQITRYYTDHSKRKCLSADIEQNILPMMVDSDMAVQEIYDLIVFDTTISDGAKQRLTSGYPFSNSKEKADFLCAVLCFSMERNFIKRETGNKKLTSGKALSPVVKDYLFGADAPKPCRYFHGRERELSELHFMLNEHSKVFLQGIPGIGKSELAKAYAQNFKKEYTNIIYINYSGNLRNDIVDLDFLEDFNANESEKERFRRHHRHLRSLKDDSLIIVDNFNTVAADEEILSIVLKYSCRILFTTRSRFDEHDTYNIEEMSDDVLFGLMGNLYSEAENHSSFLIDIIHTVHNHTFAVELSARLLEIGILYPNQLLEKLQTEKAAMNDADVIGVKKDGKSSKATYYNHIHTLFSLYKLSESETDIMRNLTLAPHNGISAKLFALWLKLENMNTVNDLIEKGFVQPLPGRMILLHPMIKEVAVDETKPSVVNCSTLLNSIHTICLHHGYDVMYYQQLFGMIDTIIELIDNDDMNSFLLFLEDVFPYMEKYEYSQLRQRIVEKMSLLLSDNTVGTVSDRALLLDYRAVLETKPSKAIQYENRAIAMITEINAGNAALVSNLYTNLGTIYQNSGNIELAVESMESAIQIAQDYNIVESHDNIVRVNNYASLLVDSGQPYRALWVLNNLCSLIKSYYSDMSIDYAITQERMGRFYSYLGDKRQALIHFKAAFDIYCIHFEAEPEKIEVKRQEMTKFLHIKGYNNPQSRTSVCGCFFVKNESILGQCVSFLLALQSPCKVVSTLTQFMTTDTALPAYIAYPKFLLEMIDLSETAKLVYIVMLDRARVSQAKDGWADENSNIFVYYPIQDLAKAIHKSEMSVKTALAALEDHALILRKRQGVGKANRIYVKLPVDRNLSARQTENCPSDGKKTVCHMERKLSGNKNKESKTNKSKRRSKAYGKFQNVFLSDGDMDSLRRTVPPYRDYIERLSTYMQSSGKRYADHAATIRCWYERDNPAQPSGNYECKDDESL